MKVVLNFVSNVSITVKTMSTTEAQKNFGNLVTQAIKEPVSITKHMKEVFVIVPANDFYEMKEQADQHTKCQRKARGLRDFIGAGRQYSRFASVEDVDKFISSNREQWER